MNMWKVDRMGRLGDVVGGVQRESEEYGEYTADWKCVERGQDGRGGRWWWVRRMASVGTYSHDLRQSDGLVLLREACE